MSKIKIYRGSDYIELDKEELKQPYDEIQELIDEAFVAQKAESIQLCELLRQSIEQRGESS